MRAVVIPRPGEPIAVEELRLDPPGAGEIRVRMLASGVCHSDLHVRDGDWKRPGPIVMGHEGAGVVEELGPGVEATSDLRVGDLVALSWLVPCGRCVSCRAGRSWECPDSPSFRHGRAPDGSVRAHRSDGSDVLAYLSIGTMAEEQVVPAGAAVKLPVETPPEVAALIGCCVATGVGTVLKTASVGAGSSSVVVGLGGVGMSVVMGLVVAGAAPIVAVDRSVEKVALARELGATSGVVATGDVEATAEAIRAAGGGRVDFAFEAIGLPTTIELAVDLVGPGGTAVLVGMTGQGVRASFDVYRFVDGGKSILGSNYGSTVAAVDFPRYAQLYLDRRLPIDRLVDRRIAIDEVESAFDRLRRGEGLRSVIVF